MRHGRAGAASARPASFADMGRAPCRKVEYANKHAAKRAIGHAQTNGIRVRRPYRCRDCGWWHLTSQLPRRKPLAA